MAQILPRDLTPIPDGTINPSAAFIVDNGDGVFKGTPANIVDAGAPINSKADAEAGLVNTGRMTPLRVAQAIAALGVSQDVLASTLGGAMVGLPQGGKVKDAVKWVTPEQFGAAGDGTTDDTAALLLWCAALGDGVNGRASGNYLISARMQLVSQNDFIIEGGGRFKIADGTSTNENYSALLVQNCTGFLIQDLFVDGNRDGRTPTEGSGHLIRVIGATSGTFRRVKAHNGTTDGWYVRGQTPADIDTYPFDVTFEDCEGINCYRNGMSIVGAVRPKIIGGRYCDNNGTLPESGIDLEANTSDVGGVVDPVIVDVEVSDNNGPGLIVTGNTGFGITKNLSVRGLWGKGNKGVGGSSGYGALINFSACEGAILSDIKCLDHPDFAPGGNRGLIHISSAASGVVINSATFTGISNTHANVWCVRADSAVAEIRNISMQSIACGGVFTTMTGGLVDGLTVTNSTNTGVSIQIAGSGTTARNFTVTNHAGTYSIYVSCAFVIARNFRVVDGVSTTAQIRFEAGATDADIDGLTVHQTSAVPSGNAVRIDAEPDILRNVKATKTSGASGSWTPSNLIFSSAGLFASTIMSGFVPDVLGASFTYDPPSISAGGSTTRTVNIAKCSVGDTVLVTAPYDLQGIIVTARVTANGTVTIYLFNPTSGAIDLASGIWTVRVVKA